MVRRFIAENINPIIHISTEVQSTDVGILSLLELGWLCHQMKALPCSLEAHGIVHLGDRYHLGSPIGVTCHL